GFGPGGSPGRSSRTWALFSVLFAGAQQRRKKPAAAALAQAEREPRGRGVALGEAELRFLQQLLGADHLLHNAGGGGGERRGALHLGLGQEDRVLGVGELAVSAQALVLGLARGRGARRQVADRDEVLAAIHGAQAGVAAQALDRLGEHGVGGSIFVPT